MPQRFPGISTVEDALRVGAGQWLSWWLPRINGVNDMDALIQEKFPDMPQDGVAGLLLLAVLAYTAGRNYPPDLASIPADPGLGGAGRNVRWSTVATFPETVGGAVRSTIETADSLPTPEQLEIDTINRVLDDATRRRALKKDSPVPNFPDYNSLPPEDRAKVSVMSVWSTTGVTIDQIRDKYEAVWLPVTRQWRLRARG